MKSLATLLVSGAGLFAMVNSSSPWVVIQKDQLAQLQALANQNVNNAFTEGASAAADSSALVDPSTTKAPAIQLAVTSSQPVAATASQPGASTASQANSNLLSMSQDPSNPLNQSASNSSSTVSPAASSPVVYYNNYYGYYHRYWGHAYYVRPYTRAVMYTHRRW